MWCPLELLDGTDIVRGSILRRSGYRTDVEVIMLLSRDRNGRQGKVLMASSGGCTGQESASIWKLGGLTFWQLASRVVNGINLDDLLGRAAELAFNFMLALFPLLLFILILFSLIASRSSQLQSSLLSYFAHLLPPVAFQLLSNVTNELGRNASRGKLTFDLIFDAVLALWFGSGGMSSMIFTLNAAYRVRESRSWFRIRLIAFGLTMVVSILLLTALLILLAGGDIVDSIGVGLHLSSAVVILWKGLQLAAAALFVIFSFSTIYYLGPSLQRRHWHRCTPGSFVGAFLWLAASAGLRSYLHFLNTYPAIYASLDAVMILLIWLYVTGLAFLIGGKVNAEIERATKLT
jgi:membrane protein